MSGTTRVVVASAVRTPIGRFLGGLSTLPAPALGEWAARAAMERAGIAPEEIDEVVFGHARQAGCGPNPARQVLIRAGIPQERTAFTVNQACASGLKSLQLGADAIRLGRARTVLVGGMENMSQVPFLLERMRTGHRLGHAPLVDGMYRDGFQCPLADMIMGETAELLAQELGIAREEQDAFALASQTKTSSAQIAGRFADELVAVTVPGRKGDVVIAADEHPRADASLARLGKLPPVFDRERGSVTAGNCSGITDGAAALVLTSADEAERRGLEPLATLTGAALRGCDPKRMGLGPVPATKALLAEIGGSLEDFDLVEINEAFAAQVLAVLRAMPVAGERLNVNGGAIALGHPIGCTGARIVVTLLHEMRRRGARRGLATLCVSGGLGMSAAFERPGT
ncbi:MAG TPA: thiolase family protein [Planctomycetota bacterium]